MDYFKMDALVSWEGLVAKELLQFEAPTARRVRLAFIANAPFEVWASFPVDPVQLLPSGEEVLRDDPDMRDVLVGAGSGLVEVEFTTLGTTFVRVLTDDDAAVFVRGFAPDMRVAESEEESFTSILPRERRNTEFDRMVMWTKLNEARREKQLQDALAALEARSSQSGVNPALAETAEVVTDAGA